MHVYNDTNIRSFRKHLRALEREITYQLKNDTNCCSVTSAQCHILLELDDDGQSGVTNLADRFGLDRSTLSRTVDGLVVAGLVGRVENPDDRRASLLSLTAKGKNTAIDIHTVCDDTYTALLSRIPTEKHESVLDSLILITDAMRDNRCNTGSCCPSAEVDKE